MHAMSEAISEYFVEGGMATEDKEYIYNLQQTNKRKRKPWPFKVKGFTAYTGDTAHSVFPPVKH